MKKVGILTYHCVTNFGAQLQTISSVGYFRRKGYEPIILHWFPLDLENFYKHEVPICQYEEQMKFAETMMPLSKLCRTIEDVASEIKRLKVDAVFIGSDALFDYTPKRNRKHFNFKRLRFESNGIVGATHDLPNAFWGSFNDYLNEPVPCSGFSISSQNAPYFRYNKSELHELKRLLGYFGFLSLRDEWTCDMVKYISGRTDVYVTPDPVFAFNINNDFRITKQYILEKYKLPEDYILISFYYDILTSDYINDIIHKVENQSGFPCVSFPMPRKLKQFNTKYKIELPLPPLDWYYLIKYSQGYIGELMHPIIVSLHNSVPFYCFDQYGTFKTIIPMLWHKKLPKSSKIYDVLKKGDFLNNMHSYQCKTLPNTDEIVKNFMAFDKNKCTEFSKNMVTKYLDAMNKVEISLNLKY